MVQLPTQSQFGDYSDWPGRDVLDSGGQRFGGVREIYLDRETGRPEWVLVDVSDSEARFVPLANAGVESESIRVAHDAEQIRSAPGIGAEPRIDQSEERRLYAHYGLNYSEIDRGSEAPTGWSDGDDSPSWQARDTAASESSEDEEPAAYSAPPAERTSDPTPTASDSSAPPLTPPWRTEAEPTNDAPPPAEPPSPAEIESAQIPEEPPASSDRGTEYETAPFGAVAPSPGTDESPADAAAAAFLTDDPVTPFSPPTSSAEDSTAGTFATTGPEDPPAGTFATTDADEPPTDSATPLTDDVDVPALTPHAAAPDLDPPALAAPIDGPSTLTPPTISHGADSPTPPPVTADAPVADDTPKPSWASSPPPLPPEPVHPGALERVKRSPGKIAGATAAAAVLFFIVRRLR
jgi:hypothetical protein